MSGFGALGRAVSGIANAPKALLGSTIRMTKTVAQNAVPKLAPAGNAVKSGAAKVKNAAGANKLSIAGSLLTTGLMAYMLFGTTGGGVGSGAGGGGRQLTPEEQQMVAHVSLSVSIACVCCCCCCIILLILVSSSSS
jgi:hypothetical protein